MATGPRSQREATSAFSTPSGAPTTANRRKQLLGAGLASVFILLLGLLAVPAIRSYISQREPLPFGGRLVLPTDTGLVVFNASDRSQTPLVSPPPGQIVTAADWSADGQQVAFGFFHRRPGDQATTSEIFVVGSDGADLRPLAERDRPGAVMDAPVWSPDGQGVYFSYFGQVDGRPVQRVMRVPAGGGQPQTVVENGYFPAISPDGQTLVFLRDSRSGQGLWRQSLASGELTPVVAEGRFPGIAAPRFSPDGSKIAISVLNTGTAQGKQQGLLAWLLPPVAYAHGDPWDIWTIDLAGGEPSRLTHINADDPSPTWSPDGRYIAIWAGNGLFVVTVETGEVRRVLDLGGYGTFDWHQ